MLKKIRFYKSLLIEIVETLCTICLYLEIEGRRNHNRMMAEHMRSHFECLKGFSEKIGVLILSISTERTVNRWAISATLSE